MTSSPRNLAEHIKTDIPGVAGSTRIFRFFQDAKVALEHENKEIATEHIYASDPSIFDILSIELSAGDPATALDGPNKIVLSESLANRLFGEKQPVGEVIKSELVHTLPNQENNYHLVVTGIYKNLPKNSHITLEALLSAETDPRLSEWDFGHFNTLTYLLLEPGIDPQRVGSSLTGIYEKYLDPVKEPVLTSAVHELVPLSEIHSRDTGGNTYLFVLVGIAFLILLISVISYVNLATAQASRRSMEVGIRKVMGSTRGQLVLQFIVESMTYVAISILVANLLVWQFVGTMNKMLGLELIPGRLWDSYLLPGMIGLWLLLGLTSGSYPAFFLSSFEPFSTLRRKGPTGVPVRRILVATQFTVLIFVLSCTWMTFQQLRYMQEKDLGFDQDKIIHFELRGNEWKQDFLYFREELIQLPQIEAVGTSSFLPGASGMGRRPISADGTAGKEAQFVNWGSFDYSYPSVIGMELLEGRFFAKEFPTDAAVSVIVNETFLRQFGIESPAVGRKIKFGGDGNPNAETIVGVVKDFHHSSLHNPIAAQIFLLNASPQVFVKLNKADHSTIASMEQIWQKIFVNSPFEFTFLNSTLQANYETDRIRGRIFVFFSCLTVLIAFLGLFGLASYLTEQRIKEIGIRKILGADLANLVTRMSREFIWLVFVAAIPAFLAAHYFIEKWLNEFAFQVAINNWYLVLVLMLSLLGTLLTTGWHTFRIARKNPAENLKHE